MAVTSPLLINRSTEVFFLCADRLWIDIGFPLSFRIDPCLSFTIHKRQKQIQLQKSVDSEELSMIILGSDLLNFDSEVGFVISLINLALRRVKITELCWKIPPWQTLSLRTCGPLYKFLSLGEFSRAEWRWDLDLTLTWSEVSTTPRIMQAVREKSLPSRCGVKIWGLAFLCVFAHLHMRK